MIPTIELVQAIMHERERALSGWVLAQRAACYRRCCTPSRIDRLARRLGRTNDCSEGPR